LAFVANGEQCLRVPERQRAVAHEGLDAAGEREQPQQVGHRRAILADRLCHLRLRQPEIVHELLVALGLFHRVEVGALEVLDERQSEERLVVEDLDDRRDLGPAEPSGGTETPLAGDELVALSTRRRPHGDRLQQAVGLERGLEFGELLGLERLARLIRVGANARDR